MLTLLLVSVFTASNYDELANADADCLHASRLLAYADARDDAALAAVAHAEAATFGCDDATRAAGFQATFRLAHLVKAIVTSLPLYACVGMVLKMQGEHAVLAADALARRDRARREGAAGRDVRNLQRAPLWPLCGSACRLLSAICASQRSATAQRHDGVRLHVRRRELRA